MEFVTAGESHGPLLSAIVSGVPAGIHIDEAKLNEDMARRQKGYGRGGRQQIETDKALITSGVRFSTTLGTPISLMIENKDYANWIGRMDTFGSAPEDLVRETTPRPGHADLVGMLKYGFDDARNILERSSARETAARVAVGGIAKAILANMDVHIHSFVKRIGSVCVEKDSAIDWNEVENMSCRTTSPETNAAMEQEIDRARSQGDSLGGQFVVVANNLVPGLGSYASGSERLTSKLGAAVFSIPAIKGVEFGMGFRTSVLPGSQVHDEIIYTQRGYSRKTNRAGGLEGGMTTGQTLIICAAMKPIPTMTKPLQTIDTDTHEVALASKERSDVCAVPSAAVVAEAEVAFVLANAYLEKFGQDSIYDILAARDAYLRRINWQ